MDRGCFKEVGMPSRTRFTPRWEPQRDGNGIRLGERWVIEDDLSLRVLRDLLPELPMRSRYTYGYDRGFDSLSTTSAPQDTG